jgi:hypothetical protein
MVLARQLPMTALLHQLMWITTTAESNPVVYPQPSAGWAHAWPYNASNSVLVSANVTIQASGHGMEISADPTAPDPLLATIIARYQLLLRNKVSAAGRFRGAPSSSSSSSSSAVGGAMRVPAAAPPAVLSRVTVHVSGGPDEALILGPATDESYTLQVQLAGSSRAATAVVSAVSVYGLRHGLESLAQLVATPSGIIVGVNASSGGALRIADRPAFAYRGLMIGAAPLQVVVHDSCTHIMLMDMHALSM